MRQPASSRRCGADQVVGAIGKDLEAVAHQLRCRDHQLERIGLQRVLVADHLELDPVRVEQLARHVRERAPPRARCGSRRCWAAGARRWRGRSRRSRCRRPAAAAPSWRFRPTVTTCGAGGGDRVAQHLRRRIAGGAEQEAAVQRDVGEEEGVGRGGSGSHRMRHRGRWRCDTERVHSATDDRLEAGHRVALRSTVRRAQRGRRSSPLTAVATDAGAMPQRRQRIGQRAAGGQLERAHCRSSVRTADAFAVARRRCIDELMQPPRTAVRRTRPAGASASSTSAGASSQPWRNRPLMRTRPGRLLDARQVVGQRRAQVGVAVHDARLGQRRHARCARRSAARPRCAATSASGPRSRSRSRRPGCVSPRRGTR